MEKEITPENLQKIDDYINGNMSEEARKAFEEEITKNEELSELVAQQKVFFSLFSDTKWDGMENNPEHPDMALLKEKLKSAEYQNTSAKIKHIGKTISEQQKTPKKRTLRYYYAAAVLLIICTLSIFMMNTTSSLEDYYDTNVQWNNLPSFVEKNNSEEAFVKGEIYFKKENYEAAIKIFETIPKDDELYPYSLMYLGASNDKLNKNEQAIENFKQLATLTSFPEYSKGYWYELLIHLKTNDKANTLKVLSIITSNKENYKYSEALQLLNNISD